MSNLDPFRSRQAPDVGARFRRERDRHERQASLMWLGVMVAMFSDHELRLLDDLGSLCPNDRDLLRQAGRPLPEKPPPPPARRRGRPRNKPQEA